ncbi:hypothetical protein [Armatimonas sp.]|uniref:hypothetical protein n=1 Tax=Armatimonas sp. TaxID=1872638 RepID=UPI0037532E9B
MTLTIDIPQDKEAILREASARHDLESLRQLLGDLATPVALALLEDDPLENALAKLRNRAPSEIASAQAAARASLQPPQHALPDGKTLGQTLAGAWPGEETDTEIASALRKLS